MNRGEVIAIPIQEIHPDPQNLRTVFDGDDLQSLAENLKEHGQLDPIQVFPRDDGKYDLLDGERRWRAAQLVGLQTLNGIIVPRPSATDLLCKKISRFMQTRNLTFPEQIHALEEGLQALGVLHKPEKWGTAAKKLGTSPAQLRERMRVTNLAPSLRSKFNQGILDYSVSQALGRIDQAQLQEKAAAFILQENLSNRFVVTQFIPAILEDPRRSLMESYDIGKHKEKYRYASPRKQEEVPPHIEERLDEMLQDFRKCLRWMEAAGRDDLISYLTPTNFNTRRVLATIRHLYHMQAAFMSAYQARYGDTGQGTTRQRKNKPELTGITKFLRAAQDSEESETEK